MISMESEVAHLSSANYEGDYTIESVQPDGSLVLKAVDTSVEAIYGSRGLSRVSEQEFERHFGDLPSGPA